MSSDPFKPIVLGLPQLTPTLVVEVIPHGLTVHRIYVQADGRTHDVIIGPEDPSEYGNASNKYKNTIIGRYTNRIPVGALDIVHPADSSIRSTLNSVSNESPTVSLHGGLEGFDAKDFQVVNGPDNLTLFSAREKEVMKTGAIASFALFRHVSPHGNEGFPGELLLEVLVGLAMPSQSQVSGPNEEYDLGSLFIVYRAKVTGKEDEKVVTPINLTHHWGFNLDASLRDGPTPVLKDHILDISASHTMDLDDVQLPTGKLNPVEDTKHEHKTGSGTLEERITDGYDHFYLFSERPKPQDVAPGRVPLSSVGDAGFDLLTPIVSNAASNPPVAVLSSPKSGIKMSFDTNQSGVQFWSGTVLDGSGAVKRIHGGTGKENGKEDGYKPNCAAFLEFHEPVAAFVHPDIVSKSVSKFDTLIGSDDLYHNFVKADLRFQAPLGGATDA